MPVPYADFSFRAEFVPPADPATGHEDKIEAGAKRIFRNLSDHFGHQFGHRRELGCRAAWPCPTDDLQPAPGIRSRDKARDQTAPPRGRSVRNYSAVPMVRDGRPGRAAKDPAPDRRANRGRAAPVRARGRDRRVGSGANGLAHQPAHGNRLPRARGPGTNDRRRRPGRRLDLDQAQQKTPREDDRGGSPAADDAAAAGQGSSLARDLPPVALVSAAQGARRALAFGAPRPETPG